jgi:hypothetical protein
MSTTQDSPSHKNVSEPVNETSAQTVRPFRPIDYYARLKKKAIKCKCVNGIVIEGVLLSYNPYELCIEISNGDEIILSKHSILFCTLNKAAMS